MRWMRPLSLYAFAGSSSTRSNNSLNSLPQQSLSSSPPVFTYTLGRDGRDDGSSPTIYIPLTSSCNTRTLPETRGPNFVLPAHVVAALCRVRDAERNKEKWKHWCSWLDTQETPQKLPPPEEDDDPSGADLSQQQQQRRPTVDELMAEVEGYRNDNDIPLSIVIGGEGEPTVRFHALLELLHRLQQSYPGNQIRINTNGLLVSKKQRQQLCDRCCRANSNTTATAKISFSVTLPTNEPDQYDAIMQPRMSESRPADCPSRRALDIVKDFIRDAHGADGLDVQITAVDRPDVDKHATQRLATTLLGGDSSKIRWRPYFP